MDNDIPMNNDVPMNNECFPEEQDFEIILNLTRAEKRELINLWKAWRAREQVAV